MVHIEGHPQIATFAASSVDDVVEQRFVSGGSSKELGSPGEEVQTVSGMVGSM